MEINLKDLKKKLYKIRVRCLRVLNFLMISLSSAIIALTFLVSYMQVNRGLLSFNAAWDSFFIISNPLIILIIAYLIVTGQAKLLWVPVFGSVSNRYCTWTEGSSPIDNLNTEWYYEAHCMKDTINPYGRIDHDHAQQYKYCSFCGKKIKKVKS